MGIEDIDYDEPETARSHPEEGMYETDPLVESEEDMAWRDAVRDAFEVGMLEEDEPEKASSHPEEEMDETDPLVDPKAWRDAFEVGMLEEDEPEKVSSHPERKEKKEGEQHSKIGRIVSDEVEIVKDQKSPVIPDQLQPKESELQPQMTGTPQPIQEEEKMKSPQLDPALRKQRREEAISFFASSRDDLNPIASFIFEKEYMAAMFFNMMPTAEEDAVQLFEQHNQDASKIRDVENQLCEAVCPENRKVAAQRITHYLHRHQDWFQDSSGHRSPKRIFDFIDSFCGNRDMMVQLAQVINNDERRNNSQLWQSQQEQVSAPNGLKESLQKASSESQGQKQQTTTREPQNPFMRRQSTGR